jgi:cytochrome b pre-mRNA-processing protein 3
LAGVMELFGLGHLRRQTRYERPALALYMAAVTAARDEFYYRALGVPDTLDGRFDLIALYAFLLVHRLQGLPEPGPTLAQAVFDAMFSDMDNNLREIGVSDLSVGKRVRAMWEAFHGRSKVYAAALQSGESAETEAALARNIWRGTAPDSAAALLAHIVMAQAKHLEGQPLEQLVAGRVRFLSTTEAAS